MDELNIHDTRQGKNLLKELCEVTTARTKVLITGREIPDCLKRKDFEVFTILAAPADIKCYVEGVLKDDESISERLDDQLKETIIDTVVSQAHGMYVTRLP